MARAVFTILFLSILYVAKVAINDTPSANGLGDSLQAHLKGEPIQFTTLKPLDSLLTLLVRFFQPIPNGNDIYLSLFTIFMAGQLLAVCVLVVVEGLRAGNRGKLISYTTFWGLLWQIITIGATLPLYFTLYLYTSPVPAARGSEALAAAISVDPVQSRAVIASVALGTLLPTILAALPSPLVVAPRTQEIFLALWQAFPLLSGITQVVAAWAVGALGLVPEAARSRPETRTRDLRRVYVCTLSFVALSCYGVVGYVFWKSGWASEAALGALVEVVRPPSPWSQKKMASVEKATLALLQWDLYCASAATWTWVVYMAYQRKGVGQVAKDLGRLVGWSALVGPGGAALAVVWGRDAEVARAAGGKRKTG